MSNHVTKATFIVVIKQVTNSSLIISTSMCVCEQVSHVGMFLYIGLGFCILSELLVPVCTMGTLIN